MPGWSPAPSAATAAHSIRRASGQFAVAGVLLVVAVALRTAALFPSYHTGSDALADDAGSLWLNVPSIAGYLVAAAAAFVAVRRPRAGMIGAGLASGVWLADLSPYVNGFSDSRVGAGYALDLAGCVACAAAAVVAWIGARRAGAGFGRSPATAMFGSIAAAGGIALAVGTCLSENGVVSNGPDGSFSESMPVLFSQTGWHLAGGIAAALVAVIVPVAAACLRPLALNVAVTAGLLTSWAGQLIAEVITVAAVQNPVEWGVPASQAADITIRLTHGPGFWVTLAATGLLTVACVARALTPDRSSSANI